MRKEIMMAGFGWISSGIICISVWLIERSFENASGLLFTGLVVIIIGAWLFLLNKRLEGIIEKFEARAKAQALRQKSRG
jgi:hypothetical protein